MFRCIWFNCIPSRTKGFDLAIEFGCIDRSMITEGIVAKDFRLSAGKLDVFIMRIVLQLRRSAQHRATEGHRNPSCPCRGLPVFHRMIHDKKYRFLEEPSKVNMVMN